MLTCAPDLTMRARVGVVPGAGVDELDIGPEQTFPLQDLDDALAAGVERDRQLQPARRVPVAVDGRQWVTAPRGDVLTLRDAMPSVSRPSFA